MRPFDKDGVFQSVAEVTTLRRVAVRSAGITMLSQGLGMAFQIISVVILARLLTPADFGLVAMVTTFSLLFSNFGLNGFTEAVLQRAEIDHTLASNLFWINLGAGILLTLAFAAAGSLMARFYGNPRVALVAVGISLTIVITSTSVLHLSLLMRAMQFTQSSAIDFISRVASILVSILLAWAGWGYWALVAGTIAQPVTQAIGAWTMCRWIPGLPRRADGTGSMVGFAAHVYGRFILNYFSRNMDNLLVGWRFNAQALGFYKKAYDLFALSALTQNLTSVTVSALSKLRGNSQQYKRFLLGALSVTAFLGMALGGDLTLIGKDLIHFLLGPRWDPAGRIFTFFGPGIGMLFLCGTQSWIHLSIGKANRWFRWAWVEFAVTGLLFVLGLRWGPAGVAMSWSVSLCILTLPALWYAGSPIQLGMAPLLKAVWKYIVASALAGLATVAITGGPSSFVAASTAIGNIARMAKLSSIFGVLYVGAVIVLYQSFKPLNNVIDLLRELAPGRRFSTPAQAFTPTLQSAAAEELSLN